MIYDKKKPSQDARGEQWTPPKWLVPGCVFVVAEIWTSHVHFPLLWFSAICVGYPYEVYYIILPFSPYRFFFSPFSFYRLSAFHHKQAVLKRFMHMPQPLINYSGSELLNTIKDMVSLFGGNVHGGVISGRWMVFEAGFWVNFVIVFVIVLCHVDSPNLWSVGHTSTWSVHTNARGASAATF